MPGVGFPRWHIQLLKVKNGSPADWQLEWQAGMFFTIAGHAAVTTLLQTPQLQAG
jgi:protein ImuA